MSYPISVSEMEDIKDENKITTKTSIITQSNSDSESEDRIDNLEDAKKSRFGSFFHAPNPKHYEGLKWWEKVIKFLEVETPDGKSPGVVESFLYNDDLKPVEAARRSWDWKQYIFFWISGGFNINNWQIAATGLQLGLNWWQTWICVWVGYMFVGIFLVLGSRVGNMYHLSFPISSRITYGTYFSLWIILNRVVMAVVWFSTLAWLGGDCVQLMLRAIFGNDLNTRLGDGMDTPNLNNFQLMCFILFWFCTLPFLWFPPHTLRYVFTFKAFITPFATFGFLIWILVKSNGKLALGNMTGVTTTLTTSAKAWAVIRSIFSGLDNFSTLILNAPDFSRFAKTPKSSILPQLISLPLTYAVISLVSLLSFSAAYELYQVNYWSPLDIMDHFLNQNFSSGNRAGVFLISTIFAFDQLGANLSSNAIPAGTDMTAILPKFINIRRGCYICAAFSLCITPWNLMASSSKFTTALAAYAVFLSAIAGVVFADYYIVRKGYVNILHCYTNHINSYYMYNKYGTNWRAVIAYLVGIVPNFPGFIGSVGPTVPIGAMEVYYLNYFIGYFVSAIVYVVLCYYFPVSGVPNNASLFAREWYEEWAEVDDFPEQIQNFNLYGDETLNGEAPVVSKTSGSQMYVQSQRSSDDLEYNNQLYKRNHDYNSVELNDDQQTGGIIQYDNNNINTTSGSSSRQPSQHAYNTLANNPLRQSFETEIVHEDGDNNKLHPY